MNNLIKIQGILTSRIETKDKENQPYYYGFFKIKDQEAEIPVIWKKQAKPNIPKGSQVLLQGNWAQSNNSRPSFTCSNYQILKDPPETTIQSLRETIQPLISPALQAKQSWTQTTDFLFKKREELKTVEQLSKLGSQYLQAYLLLKNVDYSASTNGKLELESFDQTKYLTRIASEIEPIENQIKALQAKSSTQALDIFAEKALQNTIEALAEKDRMISKLQWKLANCACPKEVSNE